MVLTRETRSGGFLYCRGMMPNAPLLNHATVPDRKMRQTGFEPVTFGSGGNPRTLTSARGRSFRPVLLT